MYPDVPAVRPVMELFRDGGFIRIKSGGRYLLADEGAVRVWTSTEAMCAQQVWVVQLVKNDDDVPFILLRGAAYGRYLATEPEVDEPGILIQSAFEDPEQENLLWTVNAVEGTSEVQLRSANRAARFTLRCTVEPIPPSRVRPHIMPAEAPAQVSSLVPLPLLSF